MPLQQGQSIYQQISEIIENQILTGALRAGEQAPSTNQFARLYHINPATALKGIGQLVEEGILYKKRGMGMFVTEEAEGIIVEKRRRIFRQETIPALLREAEQLSIDRDELCKMLANAGDAVAAEDTKGAHHD